MVLMSACRHFQRESDGLHVFVPAADWDVGDPMEIESQMERVIAWCCANLGPENGLWVAHPPMVGQGEFLPSYIEIADIDAAFKLKMRWC